MRPFARYNAQNTQEKGGCGQAQTRLEQGQAQGEHGPCKAHIDQHTTLLAAAELTNGQQQPRRTCSPKRCLQNTQCWEQRSAHQAAWPGAAEAL
jgi:hypothetical protein